MKEALTTAIAFAVALYCLFLLGIITNSVSTIQDDVKEIKQNVNYFEK
jgi:hypothetical protein